MDKNTHKIRREQWTELINACLASGMSKKAWCQQNGIGEKSFYYWQRLLRTEAYIEQKQLPVVSAKEPPVAFVELKSSVAENISDTGFHPDVVIRHNKVVMEISNTASAELMKFLRGLLNVK